MTSKRLYMREPLINTYTSYGCLFSIMNDDLWPWIYTHFIQIRYAHSWNIFAFDNHHLLLKNCPGILFYDFPQELVVSKWGRSLKDLIIDSINSGYYLYIYVDRYYISLTDCYKKDHHYHEILIYGYDLDNNTVMIADNLQNGKFITTACSFDELDEGYWSIHGEYQFWTDIRLLRQTKQFQTTINLEQMASNLENYLHSRKTFDLVEEQQFDFGFDAVNRLFTIITNATNTGETLDIRGFHLLYEHKLLMELRITHLLDHELITQDAGLLHRITSLKEDFFSIRNLVIKYNLSREPQLLNRISDKLRKSLTIEKEIISDLLEKLKETPLRD